MTALEKLKNLQAGELDKVLEGTPYALPSLLAVSHATTNAAKVEVTKVVLPEFKQAFMVAIGYMFPKEKTSESAAQCVQDEAVVTQALTLLQQLKESL